MSGVMLFLLWNCLDVSRYLALYNPAFFPLQVEDQLYRQQIEQYNQRLREFEERHRQYQEQQERRSHDEQEVIDALLCISEDRKS